VNHKTVNMISRAMEDYLKTIYLLEGGRERVSTSQLARKKKCSAASVTNMLQKLSELKLVSYKPYQGVTLTAAGRKIALQVLRHHRLLELYLQEVLGYSWDRVHEEADELEHVISEELEARIDKALGYPKHDPHGHPIPSKDGHLPSESSSCLWEARSGQRVCVSRVSDEDPEVLRHLAAIDIYPATELEVVGKAPFNGPLHVRIHGTEYILSEELARQIFVTEAVDP
jgi:DtxR family Mn-dependent transcriptional regulator